MNETTTNGEAGRDAEHRAALLDRLDNIEGALRRANEREDFESRWALSLLLEALQSNLAALRRLR